MGRGLLWAMVCLSIGAAASCQAWADEDEDQVILQGPRSTTPDGHKADASYPPAERPHRLALGISYIGFQARWSVTSKWAAEFQFQKGKASSDFGDVTARVFGLRAYRFFKPHGRLHWYVGPEAGYTTAEADRSIYSTSGFVFGAFGGFDYYLSKRLSVGADIGPYVISLKEKQTGISETSLDFVVNTTLNWHLF